MSATSTLADHIAENLTNPEEVQRRYRPPDWWAQSLANGALGVALLHVERARTGRAGWRTAHTWLAFAAAGPVDDGPDSHLHYGAPALAYVLNHASTAHPGSYAGALDVLDARIARATTARVDAAHRRIDNRCTPALCEFDAIRGLTGLGAYWLRRDPDSCHLRHILEYLVRLTEPLPTEDHDENQGEGERPGWWTHLAPNGRRTAGFPDGHANNGVSHGIAGPLALLALATRAGVHVAGHTNAIRRILTWLDDCRRGNPDRPWWPYWTSRDSQRDDGATPGRPSWCYGATGIARAQQLAGLALHDTERARAAEAALHAAVTQPDLTHRLNDPGLCHGTTGALHLARRAAADSAHTQRARELPALHEMVENDPDVAATAARLNEPSAPLGLLDGAAGIALALDDSGPGWDTCLLTS